MRRAATWTVIIIIALLVAAAYPASAAPAVQDETPTPTPSPEDETRVEITFPEQIETVSDIISIQGSAAGPEFRYYVLETIEDPAPSDAEWEQVQAPVEQQVINGVLGAWDTTQHEDGRYILRLRVVHGSVADGSIEQITDEVRVTVRNTTPTPTAAPPTRVPTVEPGTPTPGPSPTPLIQQPPTRTPRSTQTPGGPTSTPEALIVDTSPIRPERLQRAAWRGVQIALVVFGLLAVYSFIRAAYRGTLQTGWRTFRQEIINPIIDQLFRRPPRSKE